MQEDAKINVSHSEIKSPSQPFIKELALDKRHLKSATVTARVRRVFDCGGEILRKIVSLLGILVVIGAGAFAYFHFQPKEKLVLRVGVGTLGDETRILLEELSEVVERNSETLTLELVEVKSTSQGVTKLLNGSLDIATVQANAPAVPGTSLIADLYEEIFQIIVRSDSRIYAISDLAGKTMALPPPGSTELQFFWAIGDHYDVHVEEIHWRAMSVRDALDRLLNYQVDGIFLVGSVRNPATLKLIEEAEIKKFEGLRMLPVNHAPAMGLKRPYITPYTIPRGTFDGNPPLPSQDLETGAVKRIMIARSTADEEAVAELTRVMFENRSDITVRFPLASRITAPDLTVGISRPLHEGSLRYYTRDEPSFIQENAEPLALLVTVFTLGLSGLVALRTRFNRGRKNRADGYNYTVLEIGKKVDTASNRAELEAYDQQLNDVLETVVVALDTDEVTEEGFQSFSFLWESVRRKIDQKRQQTAA